MYVTRAAGGVENIGGSTETATAYLQTRIMNIGSDAFVKFLDRIISNIKGRLTSNKLTLEVYGSDDEEVGFELLATIELSKEDPGYIDVDGKRFFYFIFRDLGIAVRWALHGWTLFGEPGGEEF